MHSTPMLLATTNVGDEGNFSIDFTFPSDVPAGAHTVEVRGTDAHGDARAIAVGVRFENGSALPSTGTDSFDIFLIGFAVLVAGAILAMLQRLRFS